MFQLFFHHSQLFHFKQTLMSSDYIRLSPLEVKYCEEK